MLWIKTVDRLQATLKVLPDCDTWSRILLGITSSFICRKSTTLIFTALRWVYFFVRFITLNLRLKLHGYIFSTCVHDAAIRVTLKWVSVIPDSNCGLGGALKTDLGVYEMVSWAVSLRPLLGNGCFSIKKKLELKQVIFHSYGFGNESSGKNNKTTIKKNLT